ncbi:MAG: hypothetical protein IT448_06345 [Phycisphaerales bacterium]|nr:hypothetical protein [Phycisphaerales bacterium]
MSTVLTIFLWDISQNLRNRFLQVFALACVLGGSALLAAAPGTTTLALVLIQAILFFGSLSGCLIGWSSGQQIRAQGAFFFAQPIGSGQLLLGKLLGTGGWCLLLLLLFIGPAAVQAGMMTTLLPLAALSIGFLLVFVLTGLILGLLTAPVSGLLATLLFWAVSVAGWEVGLLVLSKAAWIEQLPWLFITLLLVNPAGAFRLGALIGLDSVPFDTADLTTGQFIFQNIMLVTIGIFLCWLVILFIIARWRLIRQEF